MIAQIKERAGESVLSARDIERIVQNLGGTAVRSTIRKNLRTERLSPQDLGVNLDKQTLRKSGKSIRYVRKPNGSWKDHLREFL